MKIRTIAALAAIAGIGVGGGTPAHAIGCLSGGAAGALAGHMMHHGVLGAVGGCVAGHEMNKHQRQAAERSQAGNANQQTGNGYQQQNGRQGSGSNP